MNASRCSHLLCLFGGLLLTVATGCLNGDSASDYARSEPTPPAAADLKSQIDEIIDYTLHERLLSARDQAAWQVVHGLEAFGRSLPLEHDGKVSPALDYLMAGEPLKGWVMRPGDKGVISLSDPGSKTGQGHPDQWLGYLSQCGDVKLDDPLVVGGKTYKFRDLITQAQWDIFDGMEASWTLMALVTYLPMDTHWTAKDGKEWTTEKVAEMEALTKPGTGGCGDSHRLYALTIALNRHLRETGQKGEQLKGPWANVYRRVESAKKAVRDFQQRDGTFSTAFFERPAHAPDLGARIYSGGHTLEFLAVALTPDELDEDWVTEGVARLCEQINDIRRLNPDCGTIYHAAHGLMLYRATRFGQPSQDKSLVGKRD